MSESAMAIVFIFLVVLGAFAILLHNQREKIEMMAARLKLLEVEIQGVRAECRSMLAEKREQSEPPPKVWERSRRKKGEEMAHLSFDERQAKELERIAQRRQEDEEGCDSWLGH